MLTSFGKILRNRIRQNLKNCWRKLGKKEVLWRGTLENPIPKPLFIYSRTLKKDM